MARLRRPVAKTSPGPAALSLRDLNRATLARQLLLARAPLAIPAAVQRLVGLQAQWPAPPYVGLWTRLAGFRRDDLAQLIARRTLVRATFARGTLHLVHADDFLRLRAVFQPMLERTFAGMAAARVTGIDPHLLAAEARPFLLAAPHTQDDVRDFLLARHPKLDERLMGHAVRLHLPLVQIPGPGTWGFPAAPQFALAESWLGRPLAAGTDPRKLIRRYLAAFGPATVRDAQTWSGLPGLREAFETLRPELVVLRDEAGRELFDLPDSPRPKADTPAPPRFLPEYDNLLLAYADRTRVVADEFKPRVFLPGLRVAATILVDGFVRGVWRLERAKKTATLVIEPFAALTKADRTALAAEAENLVRLGAPDAATWSVQFAKP